MLITSVSNEKIKSIRKLRDRKERQSSGLFFVEGLRIVIEAAQSGARFESVICSPELLISQAGKQLVQSLTKQGVPIIEVSAEVFSSLSAKDGPQGLAAVLHQNWLSMDKVSLEAGELWVALDSIQDPGNLGTILRTLDAVGGKGVFLLDHCADPYDPATARASMGALFNLALVRVSFADFSEWKKSTGVSLIGTSGYAQVDYHSIQYPDPLVIMMGSERQGLLEHHIALCDQVVSIPMVGRSDSLNLAVATAVVLYEVFNQRRLLGSRE